MDYKCTLDTADSFLELLKSHFEHQQKVSLLSDIGGWERAEGMVREIVQKEDASYLVLDNGTTLDISKVIAVNGVFKTGCSC
ncbi:hypothetical protein LL912_03885 [Niabella sp. CC-SYL272]|uniref:hypothetical protein n=1 Tax=Niabella agricola TaxID=2891571 RepID=UPI001F2D438B|nr:hypothetical protein [Niabella agricola]MCF3107911.1 hypothetical protein [Niabella agricola]